MFLLGKSFFANSSGLGCWESVGLLAKPQFPVVLVIHLLSSNEMLSCSTQLCI
jgi:hypothetical protein